MAPPPNPPVSPQHSRPDPETRTRAQGWQEHPGAPCGKAIHPSAGSQLVGGRLTAGGRARELLQRLCSWPRACWSWMAQGKPWAPGAGMKGLFHRLLGSDAGGSQAGSSTDGEMVTGSVGVGGYSQPPDPGWSCRGLCSP